MQHILLRSYVLALLAAVIGRAGHAATLATATYDNDSYMFVGLNTETEPAITLTEDYSLGQLAQNNAHFIFGVVKFGNLSGLTTKATGGGDKYLALTTSRFPGPASLGITIAQADIEANDATGYPSPLFLGNRFGLNTDRLSWYMANIKGDNAAYGGYAGGAPHLGVMQFSQPGTQYLNVTTAVDAWIDGTRPNHGFGIWGITVSGGQDNTFDLFSMNDPSNNGPSLVSSPPGSGPTPGDANSDGRVDRSDLAQLVRSFGASSANWSNGDFNSDGRVGLADIMVLRANLTGGGLSPQAAVPEPNSIFLTMGCVAGFVASRRVLRRCRNDQTLKGFAS
jgi:hypothetical protein